MNIVLNQNKVLENKVGIIPRIKSFFGASSLNAQQLFIQDLMESQISRNVWQIISGSHSFNRRSLETLYLYGYEQNPIVFGIVQSILFKQENLKYTPYRNGKVYKSGEFKINTEKAYFNLLTTGTCVYWNREVVGFGRNIEVIDTINLQEYYNRGVFTYRYYENDVWINIPDSDLFFVKFMDNPNNKTRFGLSPLQAAIMPIEALREMYTADTSLLKNKGSELLVSNNTQEPLLENSLETFDQAINNRISGAKKFGTVATTTANVQVHQLGRTIKELALWDGYKVKTRDICIALNYPPVLAGDSEANKFATYGEAKKATYSDCVIPLAKKLFKGLDKWLGYEVFIDTSEIDCLQQDQKERTEKAKNVQTAIIELNTQVKNGVVSKEIAVNILTLEWGYDEEEATKMTMDSFVSTDNSNTTENVI